VKQHSNKHANSFVLGPAVINTHTPALCCSNSNKHTALLVRDGQTRPHRPRLVVSRSTCPPISPLPHANSFELGPAVINTHTQRSTAIRSFLQDAAGRRSLVFDLSITHDRIGSSCHVQQNFATKPIGQRVPVQPHPTLGGLQIP
jgi:hypothetical protein